MFLTMPSSVIGRRISGSSTFDSEARMAAGSWAVSSFVSDTPPSVGVDDQRAGPGTGPAGPGAGPGGTPGGAGGCACGENGCWGSGGSACGENGRGGSGGGGA